MDSLRLALCAILILVAALVVIPAAGAAPPPTGDDCGRSGCHVEPDGAAFAHRLVEEGDCTACHQPGAAGGERHPGVVGEPELVEFSLRTHRECRPCHDDHQLSHGTEGAVAVVCSDCHDPHAGATATLLRGRRGESCLSCHGDSFEPSRQKKITLGEPDPEPLETELRRHGAVEEDSCDECHLMHTGSPKGLLRGEFPLADYASYDRAVYSACLESCHLPDLVEEERTNTTTRFRNGDDNLHFRHVAARSRGRSCRLCHAPHRAWGPGLVREGMPFGKERLTLEFSAGETGGRCETSCHIPAEYDRTGAIPSRMRVREPDSNWEKKP